MKRKYISAAVMAFALPSIASAHATLEQKEAAQGTTTKITVRISHGCDGEATQKVRVQVPEGIISVKPMPKAGWTLDTVTSPYENTYAAHGAPVTEGVTEITWTGELPDAFYDEFSFRGTIADTVEAGTTLYVPIVQECANGSERWIQIPAADQSSHDLESPAPGIDVLPAVGD